MEMQQIKYFLALSRTLNFTRAAEECNVSQSSLTRAVKALEAELGGDLIRREGSNTHLTDLGNRMLPFMQRCFDSALTAKSLAKSLAQGAVTPLSVSISHSVSVDTAMSPITEMFRNFPGLQLKLLRGTAPEVVEFLKQGVVEIAIAGPLEDFWDRLDHWPLYEERYELAFRDDNQLALDNDLTLEKLKGQSLFCLNGCEVRESVMASMEAQGVPMGHVHEAITLSDVGALIQNGLGVALVPQSVTLPDRIRRRQISDLPVIREVSVYAVAGRPRTPATSAFLNLLRSTEFTTA